jgi:hypothetical protein
MIRELKAPMRDRLCRSPRLGSVALQIAGGSNLLTTPQRKPKTPHLPPRTLYVPVKRMVVSPLAIARPRSERFLRAAP